jgi:hypothetical protein
MSYTIDVVEVEIPADDQAAWELREHLLETAEARDPSAKMLELYHNLKAKHPCIMEDPDGPWSDGPLLGNFRSPVTTLGISYSRVEDALPSVISIATSMGFTVFDPDNQTIHGPRVAASRREPDAANIGTLPKSERKWWQIWK